MVAMAGANQRPIQWEDLVDEICSRLTGSETRGLGPLAALPSSSITVSWGPSVGTIVAAVLRRRLVYLCWGVPRPSKRRYWNQIRFARLRFILRRASVVLTNDPVTSQQVSDLVSRSPAQIPYVVDTSYFTPLTEDSDKLVLAPGNNGRDEELICSLSDQGIPIVRVTYDKSVREFYLQRAKRTLHPVKLEFGVSFARLRELYRRASLVVLPLTAQNHPAGQTSLLEALACGPSVLLSAGRSASLFADYPGVHICDSHSLSEWTMVASKILASTNDASSSRFGQHQYIRARHSPRVVGDILGPMLEDLITTT